MKMLLVLFSLSFLCIIESYKILVVFSLPGKSHSLLGNGYVRHLLEAGHEVTYITPFPWEKLPPRLHQVDVSSLMSLLPPEKMNFTMIMNNEIDLNDMTFMFSMAYNFSQSTYEHENVVKLINDPTQSFDAVVVEWFFSELFAGFSAIYNCPLIWSSSLGMHWLVQRLVDYQPSPAYSGDILSTNTLPFNFFQRVEELWKRISTLKKKYFLLPLIKEGYEKSCGPAVAKRGRTLPPYEDIIYNGSLVLLNSNLAVEQTSSVPPNVKFIGGYHIEETKPLTEDLQKLMDNSKNGVIYFSMGSNLRSKDMPEELKKGLLKTFGGLKQTVIWKFEEVLSDLPKNVHILTWAPQASILAHPKCLLFITHGGLLSTTETIYYGVPTIVIPVYGDQFVNAKRAVSKGFARKVDLSYDLPKTLKPEINEVLNNPSYRQTVKKISSVFHDGLIPPGKELVYWIEHVIRTKGAPHLRSTALTVPWYQQIYLDLILIIFAFIFLVIIVLRRILCSKKKVSVEKKKK